MINIKQQSQCDIDVKTMFNKVDMIENDIPTKYKRHIIEEDEIIAINVANCVFYNL